MADIFNITCSSVTQAMICYIFWNIDNIQPPVVRGQSIHDEVQVEETDEFFDLQLRLWYQFMRDPEDRPSIYKSTLTQTTARGSFVENEDQTMQESLLEVNEEPNQLGNSLNSEKTDI